jgi:molybdenum cofactor biosynthesis enzyme
MEKTEVVFVVPHSFQSVGVALLAIHGLCKAVDRGMVIESARPQGKPGDKSEHRKTE